MHSIIKFFLGGQLFKTYAMNCLTKRFICHTHCLVRHITALFMFAHVIFEKVSAVHLLNESVEQVWSNDRPEDIKI